MQPLTDTPAGGAAPVEPLPWWCIAAPVGPLPGWRIAVAERREAGNAERQEPLRVKRHKPEATLPHRATDGSAGYDLCAAVDCSVEGGGRLAIATELSVAVPSGHYGRIAPRSGLAMKQGINVGAGVLDSDYRGKVGVILFNHSDITFEVKAGDRIAQLILERISTPKVVEVDEMEATERGTGGFGSTGVKPLLPSSVAEAPHKPGGEEGEVEGA